MRSRILTLQKAFSSISSPNLKRVGFTRGYSSQSSSSCAIEQLDSHLRDLHKSLSPTVIALESFFSAPDIHRSGTGVFVDPDLILTSAHVVARIATFYEPKSVHKCDRFEHGYILHKSSIGSTVAIIDNTKLLKTPTTPLAVNFANDLAVLKLVKPEEKILLPHCSVTDNYPEKEDILMTIASNSRSEVMCGNVRSIGEKTVRAKAPWPLDDGAKWMEHDWRMFPSDPPIGSALFNSRGKINGVVSRVSGSPWFNLDGEVVGISSWEVNTDEPARFSVGFAVSSLSIKAVLEYAKMKRPEDPVVMDSWIDSNVTRGVGDEDVERNELIRPE